MSRPTRLTAIARFRDARAAMAAEASAGRQDFMARMAQEVTDAVVAAQGWLAGVAAARAERAAELRAEMRAGRAVLAGEVGDHLRATSDARRTGAEAARAARRADVAGIVSADFR